MTEHNEHGRPSSESTQERHRPYWTRAHRDWRFWVVLIFMIAAMVIYVVTQDLSFGGPKSQPRQPQPIESPVGQ